MISHVVSKDTIDEAWRASLKLFREREHLHYYDSMRGPCLEFEDLIIRIKYPTREPRIGNLFPKQFHALIESYTDELLNVEFKRKSTVNTRLHKWMRRNHEEFDQLKKITEMLIERPESRYNVIGFWDPDEDLGRQNPVSPISLYYRIRSNKLISTVVVRTLDAWLGAIPLIIGFANLQSFLANQTRSSIGHLSFFIYSYHVYEMDLPKIHTTFA